MDNQYLGWQDPIDQLLSLRAALNYLLARSKAPRERFSGATLPLVKYHIHDFPERLRQRVENIRNARVAVRQDYVTDSLFRFDLLSVRECRAIQGDILALYEACLLDLGRMHAMGGMGEGLYEIVYPKDAQPLTVKPRANL